MSDRRRSLFHQPNKSEDGRYIWLAPVGCSGSYTMPEAYLLDTQGTEGFQKVIAGSNSAATVSAATMSNDSFCLADGTLITTCMSGSYVSFCALNPVDLENKTYVNAVNSSGGATYGELLFIYDQQTGLATLAKASLDRSSVGITYYTKKEQADTWISREYSNANYISTTYNYSTARSTWLGTNAGAFSGSFRYAGSKTFVRSVDGNVLLTVPVTYGANFYQKLQETASCADFRLSATENNGTYYYHALSNLTSSMLPAISGTVDPTIQGGMLTDAAMSQTGKMAYITYLESGSSTRNYTGSLWKSSDYCNTFYRLPWVPDKSSDESIIGVATSADAKVVYITTFTAGTRVTDVNFVSGSVYCSVDGGDSFEKKISFKSNRYQNNGGYAANYGSSQRVTAIRSYGVIENRIQIACSADGRSACILYYDQDESGNTRNPICQYTSNFGKTWKKLAVGFSELSTTVSTELPASKYVGCWNKKQYKLIMNRSILDNVE